MNLCCGFAAILMADLHMSSIMLLIGMFFDVIDGLAARMLKVQSKLGAELDSFADLVSFGLAPAYLYTQLIPSDRWFYYIPAFFILIGSTLRLAIFNLRPSTTHFIGLPTPASAFFIIGIFIGVEFGSEFVQSLIETPSIYIMIPAILMMLNLSRIRMFSFKQIGLNQGYKLFILISLVTFVFLTIYNFKLSMPIAVILYVILSLIHSIKIQK
jgi:CDP-diacylglycerol---serine O-phosphatidyltransferase